MEHRAPPDELAAAHPALRTVAPPDAPYPGVLRRVDGSTRLFVDAADYAGIVAWECDPSGHVLAPLDVARRRDGHDIVLEHCVERIDALLDRRGASAPLSDGETVTLAVSLRRGLAELLGAGDDVAAQWWLTEDGRPVLACVAGDSAEGDADGGADAAGRRDGARSDADTGGRRGGTRSDADAGGRRSALRTDRADTAVAVALTATEATAEILSSLQRHASPAIAEALDALLEAVGRPRALTRDADLLEGALFAVASPLPIAREASTRRSSLAGLVPERREPVAEPTGRWEELLHGHLDSQLADLASAALRSVRGRIGHAGRSPRSDPTRRRRGAGAAAAAGPAGRDDAGGQRTSRGRPWLVAGCLAVAVIGVGMLWPSTSGGDTAAADIGATAAPTGTASGLAEDAASGSPTDEGDDAGSHASEPSSCGAGDAGSAAPGVCTAETGEAGSASPGAATPLDSNDPLAGAAALLDAAADCDGDAACAATLVEDPAGPTAARLVAVAADATAAPALIDTYGGAAVVRVAHDGSSSLIVVVQATTGGALDPSRTPWLVRDVYDVADQP